MRSKETDQVSERPASPSPTAPEGLAVGGADLTPTPDTTKLAALVNHASSRALWLDGYRAGVERAQADRASLRWLVPLCILAVFALGFLIGAAWQVAS